jgi:Fe2+ transport system protein FeoA
MRVRVALLILALLAAPLAAEAQQAGKTAHIGILSSGQTRSSPLYEAFERRLRELGYTNGRNATIEFRGAEGAPARIVEPFGSRRTLRRSWLSGACVSLTFNRDRSSVESQVPMSPRTCGSFARARPAPYLGTSSALDGTV